MTQRPPNIVLMIAHDLGCRFGPYGWCGEQSTQLNRFASQSIRLERHFVTSPGCSPSRASLVTGRYPHSNGQWGLSHLGWTLNRDEVVLPQTLRDAGYRTALFGIWHLHEWSLAGFDDLSADVSCRDASPEGFAEIASDRAADWLNSSAAKRRPFYLHVGFWEPHRPFRGHERCAADWPDVDPAAAGVPDYLPDNESTRRELADFARCVGMVDAGVGRILEAVDRAGLENDTLVIFTSDHGIAFPRAKGTLYDPGIQVGFLARWPGRIRPGTSSPALTSNVDCMPTLLEAARAASPDRVQGASFLDLLTGANATGREAVFAEKTYHEHYDPIRCVRTGRFKYIRNFADRPRLVLPSDIYNSPTRQAMTDDESIWSHRPAEELYDLNVDPSEINNLAASAEYAETRASLRAKLDRWMRETGDPLLNGPMGRPAAPSRQGKADIR
jgi:arylsulfatase A-like enzyme